MTVPSHRPDSQPIVEAAELFKRLGHPSRLAIARCLIDGERSVGELEAALGLQQPSLSQQLTELRKSGMITARRQAKQVFYTLTDRRVERILALVDARPLPTNAVASPRCMTAPLSAAVFATVGQATSSHAAPNA